MKTAIIITCASLLLAVLATRGVHGILRYLVIAASLAPLAIGAWCSYRAGQAS